MAHDQVLSGCNGRFSVLETRAESLEKHKNDIELAVFGNGTVGNRGLLGIAESNQKQLKDHTDKFQELEKAREDIDVKKWAIIIIIVQAIIGFITSVGTAVAVTKLSGHP